MSTIADSHAWLHFAGRSGEAGRAWVAEYQRHAPFVDLSLDALALLRRRRLEEGHVSLEALAQALAGLEGVPATVRWVLNRWYHGVAAYYYYCIDDFDRARQAMNLAYEAVVDAISGADFLLLLAVHCHEFRLHLARIARNQRFWSDMHHHVELARAMMLDRIPLCRLRNGRSVFFSTLGEFFHSLEPLSPDERESIGGLVEEERRLPLFDKFVRRLHSLPGFAISYP